MALITTINDNDLITDGNEAINQNFQNLNTDKIETSYLDTDTALAANSDTKIATQKAVKAYVDSGGNPNASETQAGIVEEATDAEVAAGTATGATGAKLFVTPAKLTTTNVQTFTSDGTWTKPTNAKFIDVFIIGAGGGGGNGVNNSSNAAGGGGGSGGGFTRYQAVASTISSPVTVTVGVGGTANVDGEASSFGTYAVANGGVKGANGVTITGGAGGTPGGSGIFLFTSTVATAGGAGGNQQQAGSAGVAASTLVPTGGGGGGGSANPGERAGGAGGAISVGTISIAGGTGGTTSPATAGGAGTSVTANSPAVGTGGGGGTGDSEAAGKNGGAGGLYGGGGGGGGGGDGGGGTGGTGANGIVVVVSYI